MKGRYSRFRWGGVILLLAVVSGSMWIFAGQRPRSKHFVLQGYRGGISLPRTAISFDYPADFEVVEYASGDSITLAHVPPTGLAARIQSLLSRDRQVGWDFASIEVQYQTDGSLAIEDEERFARQLTGNVQRVRYRSGPAVTFDEPVQNGFANRYLWLFPEVPWTTGLERPSISHVDIHYTSTKLIEPQVREIVDEIVSGMRIVPL